MRLFKQVYLSINFFYVLGLLIALFTVGFSVPVLYVVAQILFAAFALIVVLETLILWRVKDGILARRITPEKLSNGDLNSISIYIRNYYRPRVHLNVIDELPTQFQVRDSVFKLAVESGEEQVLKYELRPTKRGSYSFGAVNVFASVLARMVVRRYQFDQNVEIPVFPSFLQMHQFELMAFSQRLTGHGLKKVRRIGQSMEFEQVRDYVIGDDRKRINWKATARKKELMVNQYQDERSQPIYCVIDKGRSMKMPFNGLSLLDYSINASLVLSNIALKKDDKAGIICFSNRVTYILPAERKKLQMQQVLQTLYNQKTAWQEPDFEKLVLTIKSKIRQRSLLLFFTNYESIVSMRRHAQYLSRLSKDHLVVMIIFRNTEVDELALQTAETLQDVYTQTLAEKANYEKKLVIKELSKLGIQAIYTSPEDLNTNVINKYLELKARGRF